MKFYGDLLLTDPAYIVKSDADWQLLLSEGYDRAALHLLGIRDSLSFEAGEDGRRIVRKTDGTNAEIGRFCTDSALFCVCDLAQVLAYNSDFLRKNENYPDTFCIVHDFDGEVSVRKAGDGTIHLSGTGKNAFRTTSE